MASYTIGEMLMSIFIGLWYYAYVELPAYNQIIGSLSHLSFPIPMLEYNLFTVIMYGILSLPLALIIGCVIYAFDQISYRTGYG